MKRLHRSEEKRRKEDLLLLSSFVFHFKTNLSSIDVGEVARSVGEEA